MNIEFALWYRNEKNNFDKVYGAIKLAERKYIFFWGRRGKKLQVSDIKSIGQWTAQEMGLYKIRKGYINYTHSLDLVYPEFQKDIEKIGIWASLKLD